MITTPLPRSGSVERSYPLDCLSDTHDYHQLLVGLARALVSAWRRPGRRATGIYRIPAASCQA